MEMQKQHQLQAQRRAGPLNLQEVGANEAMMEHLLRQDRQERLDAHISKRARQEAEAVMSARTPGERGETPPAGNKPSAPQVPAPVPMPRPMYYGPAMPQMGYGYPQMGYNVGYQTPVQQQTQRNNPFHGIMI